jgi:hypothetical protein
MDPFAACALDSYLEVECFHSRLGLKPVSIARHVAAYYCRCPCRWHMFARKFVACVSGECGVASDVEWPSSDEERYPHDDRR